MSPSRHPRRHLSLSYIYIYMTCHSYSLSPVGLKTISLFRSTAANRSNLCIVDLPLMILTIQIPISVSSCADRFEHIKSTHPLKASIPTSWPTEDALEALVDKVSVQFIYAATVVGFIESIRHQPTTRLEIVLGISAVGNETIC